MQRDILRFLTNSGTFALLVIVSVVIVMLVISIFDRYPRNESKRGKETDDREDPGGN